MVSPMTEDEYLVSYGKSGEFARFRPVGSDSFRRGDRVVVRTHQGLEMGLVLCPANIGHAPFLSRTSRGELLRRVTEEDEQAVEETRRRGRQIFDDGRRLAGELGLPLEILDVELLLDGQQAIIHHIRREECDFRPLVSTLSKKYDVLVTMQNLALPKTEESIGCGKPDCGQVNGGGGCTSCGTNGGCGTCGKGVKKEDVAAHLLALRQMMESRARTSLL
jgi:cell fate regulator YaaT (PSP1 superfamily)